ncbi:MAG: cyanophycin synthetase [Acidobacteriota bacterium]|nr:cyanophycin synthetase [Acidobacteriota bacterium]
MKIENIRAIAGANVYSHQPVVLMRLNLEDLTEKESREFEGFNRRLVELLPGLAEHHCGLGYPGGFLERLEEGTYFGHIVEHAAIEMMTLAEIGADYGKTRYAGEPGVYNVVVVYKAEEATKYLLKQAVELVNALLKGESFSIEEIIEEAKQIAADYELGPSARAIVDAAEKRGIPWSRENEYSLIQLGYGKNLHYAQSALTDQTSNIGVETAGDKNETKQRLEKFSIPVPRGEIVTREEEVVSALEYLGAPVVVKPLDGRQGKGVSLNLSEPQEVREAFHSAREYSRDVLVEELFQGRNYRVLVIGGKMVAASERVPCHVLGDGKHTVAELIDLENNNPLRGEGHEKPLTKIKVDPILLKAMRKEGWQMTDLPEAGERVNLCAGMNLSTGGTAEDVTDEVHPTIRNLCERAARIINLDVCGVDLVIEDISQPMPKEKGGVIELNAAPGLRMHVHPSKGTPRDVGSAIVEMLYPAGKSARIPIISITGTNGKTTVTRMIAHVLLEQNLTVGMTTTDGIYLNGELIVEGDTTGPISAKTILGDRSVEVAVLETARGGIIKRGLGYDWSDVSVMTNISADHLGQDGIENVEDLLWIKSLVAERVKKGGTLILNAEDELLTKLPEKGAVKRVEKQIVYFSMNEQNPVLQKHISEGKTAYFVRDNQIFEVNGGESQAIADVLKIPATMNGTAEFQVANVMSAIAACRAYGLKAEQIAESLARFQADANNPGRTNLYKIGAGYVLIDYGHNPEAFAAVCRMAANWQGKTVTGIIGVPGDRNNSVVEEAGRVAARGFHRIIIKEDHDTRGRKRGEIANLLCQVVSQESPDRHCSVVYDEVEAFEQELKEIKENQVIVLFYDKLAPVLEILKNYDAIPVLNFEETAAQATS